MLTSVVKWSEVQLGEVKMGRSEVSTSVVKWSDGLSNIVSFIIIRCVDKIHFVAYVIPSLSHFFPYSSASILCHCI